MSDEDEIDDTWIEFFSNNKTIPPHGSQKIEHGVQAFPFYLKIKLVTLEFQAQSTTEFQLRITFYDTANHHFLGSTWIGATVTSKISNNNQHSISIDEPLYFSTSLNSFTTIAVIELIHVSTQSLQIVGWSWIRIFSQFESLTDTDETARPQEKKLEFFHGSPVALLNIPEPIEEFPQLKTRSQCSLVYTLQTHEALHKVIHLIPENVVVNGDDIIPGILEDGEADNGVIDILQSPVLLRSWPCHLNKLNITMVPSIEKFEQQLCTLLNEDRLVKDGLQPDGSVVSIAERKLRVGVHNGWKFVKPPHVLYLEKDYAYSTPSKRYSPNPGSSLSNSARDCIGLVLRNRLELDEIVQHQLFAICFQIEYVVNIPVSQPEIPAGRKARNKLGSSFGSIPLAKKVDFVIRSAIWVPFENGKINNGVITLDLEGGFGPNPFGSMTFSELHDFPDDLHFDALGKLEFSLVQTKLKKTNPPLHQKSLNVHAQVARVLYTSSDELSTLTPANIPQLNGMSSKPPLPQQMQQHHNVNQMMSPQKIHHAQHLSELPRSQMYTPLIVSNMQTPKPVPLSRVAHSLLYSVDYPQISDHQGKHPFIVDPQESVNYELSRENRDPLHTNEIIIQFLAVSRCLHPTVFFTFQFYRFPQTTTERLHLKQLDGTDKLHTDMPFVLQKSSRDGTISQHSPPGLMIKYTVDPSYLQPGEKLSFLKYLLQQRLYIDMWDGNSLLLIGSTSIELKHLLRQGQSSVQVSQELDVVFVEYAEENSMLAGDTLQKGLPQPVGVKMTLEGKLFIRMANIGCLPDTNSDRLKEMPKSFLSTVIESNLTKMTNGKTASHSMTMPARSTAKLMSDCDPELATVLLTRKDVPGKTLKMKENDANTIRKRKMDRMNAIRQLDGGGEITSSYILQKEEKVQRTRDLRTIQLYREKYKSNNILAKLEESITVHHMIHAALGRAEYFEFSLINPYPKDMTVFISCSDDDLSIITNSKEWRHYKILTDTNTVMEEQMFSSATDEGVKVFMRGSEKVYIPFKYQSFTSQHSTPELGPSHPLYTKSTDYSLQTFGKDTTLSSKDIKVTFRGFDNKPIAALILHVELHPHTINQTFRFYQPEQTFLKKAIRLPPLHTLPGASVLTSGTPLNVVAKCSDNRAICETHQVQVGEPQEIFIKVPCGISPNVNRFFVVVYIDEYCSVPCQIWQFYVHSLQRVDINATEGQCSQLSLLLKGTKSSRIVKCYSSHHNELKITPQDHFMLMANGVQEVSLSLNPLEAGKRMMFVNVVDKEFHQLVKSWLVMATCSPPVITKAFEVHLKVGGGMGSNKKISFINPYPVKKNFYFKTNREDLLQFKEEGVLLGGGESHNIGLYFLPQQSEGSATILIFINDRDGKNEEAFCVKVNYII